MSVDSWRFLRGLCFDVQTHCQWRLHPHLCSPRGRTVCKKLAVAEPKNPPLSGGFTPSPSSSSFTRSTTAARGSCGSGGCAAEGRGEREQQLRDPNAARDNVRTHPAAKPNRRQRLCLPRYSSCDTSLVPVVQPNKMSMTRRREDTATPAVQRLRTHVSHA